MKHLFAWVGVAALLVACGDTTDDDDEAPGTQAGSGGESHAEAGSAGSAGQASTASGGAGGADAGGAGAGGEAGAAPGGEAGAAGSLTAGAGGAAPDAPCNELELIVTEPSCSEFTSAPEPSGGPLQAGLYTLDSFESPLCFGLEQTLSITETAADTFSVETVTNLDDGRANAVFVLAGTTLTSTASCGNDDPLEIYDYSAYEDGGSVYLRLSRSTDVFTYRRVAD